MIYDKTDEATEEIFESLLSSYQTGLEESMKRSDFVFDCVNLLLYRCHKINLGPEMWWIIYKFSWLDKKQEISINPINDGDTCSQYAATVALNHEKMVKNLQRI